MIDAAFYSKFYGPCVFCDAKDAGVGFFYEHEENSTHILDVCEECFLIVVSRNNWKYLIDC